MRRINRYIPLRIQNYFHEKKESILNQEEFKLWVANGCPVPPPHSAKQKVIEKYAKQYSCSTLVETGTYLGDTIYSQKDNFTQIISVELSHRFYKAASRRFKNYPHIRVFFGNSGELLPEIIPEIKNRSLLWLDGHYSGGLTARGETESPVFKELDAIFNNNDALHVILIDDARLFIGKRDYPTMDELEAYVKAKNRNYKISTESDIIVLAIPQNLINS
jgi:hypothetical protein